MKISAQLVAQAITYPAYIKIVKDLFEKGLITGKDQTPGYLEYTKLNLQRYGRLEKTVVLSADLQTAIDHLKNGILFVVITEGWCGDAAQNIGVFEAMARYSNKVSVKYLFRDEHPELMDQYLTNGTRSIPKAICCHADTLEVFFDWGPRPAILQNQVKAMAAAGASKEERSLFIHSWYHKDKTTEIQKEIAALLRAAQ